MLKRQNIDYSVKAGACKYRLVDTEFLATPAWDLVVVMWEAGYETMRRMVDKALRIDCLSGGRLCAEDDVED